MGEYYGKKYNNEPSDEEWQRIEEMILREEEEERAEEAKEDALELKQFISWCWDNGIKW